MPRLIDHQAREVAVGEAAWRVLVREGPGGLSVRTVAAEAGLATGSLRRAFPTQTSLAAFALDLVRRRTTARIEAIATDGPVVDVALAMLSELLPLDAQRRMEMEVFLALGSMALSDAGLRRAHQEAHTALGLLCAQLVVALGHAAQVRYEGRRVHALLDGLSLHLVRQPAGADVDWALDVLHRHLTSLV